MVQGFIHLLKNLIRTSRPLLWPAVVIPFLIGGLFADAHHAPAFWLCLLTLTLPYNFVLYGVNDAYDVETDANNVRKEQYTLLAGSNHSASYPIALFVFISILILSSVMLLGYSWETSSWYAALLLLAFLYSVPPVRLKECLGIDSIANGFLYFFVPFALGFSIGGDVGDLPIARMLLLVLSVAGFHLGASVLDIEADTRAGMVTTATRFGARVSLFLELLLVLPGLWVLWNYYSFRYYLIVVAIVLVIVMCHPEPRFARYMGYVFLYGGFVLAAGIFIFSRL